MDKIKQEISNKDKQIIAHAIRYLVEEKIISARLARFCDFSKSYLPRGEGSVIILGETKLRKIEVVNIEINYYGDIYNRLNQKGRGTQVFPKRTYHEFMKESAKNQEKPVYHINSKHKKGKPAKTGREK